MYQYYISSQKKKSLIAELYYLFLQEDSLWFYSFYENDNEKYIKLRVANRHKNLEKYLSRKHLTFEGSVYNRQEEVGEPTIYNNFNEYIKAWHAFALLIILSESNKNYLLAKLFHLLCNMDGRTYQQESKLLWFMVDENETL